MARNCFIPNNWRQITLTVIDGGRSKTRVWSEDTTQQRDKKNRQQNKCSPLHHQLTPQPKVDDEVLEAFVHSRRRNGRM